MLPRPTLDRAHLEKALRRTLDADEAGAILGPMQGGHEAVGGVERYQVAPLPPRPLVGRLQAELHRKGHQRAFHRVALDLPDAAGLVQRGVVAEQRRAGEIRQPGFCLQIERLVAVPDLARG